MRSGIFGWSYPPGCSGTPWDEDYPCEICGEFEDNCVCPECPECGDYGNPDCYLDHGMKRTELQKFTAEVNLRAVKSQNDAYWREYEREHTCLHCGEREISDDYEAACEGLCDRCFKEINDRSLER